LTKHRNGETGRIKLAWTGQYTRFDNLAYDNQMAGAPDEGQIDAAYLNNMANFDKEPF
jgi:primary replicative DNA helicase (EC 3.6.1.-)